MTKKLRLFALRLAISEEPIPGLFFHDQPAAKREREKRIAAGENVVVTWGPDHKKAKTPVTRGTKHGPDQH